MNGAINRAIAAHAAYGAMSCDDPLTDCLISQCTQPAVLNDAAFDARLAAHFPPSRRLACAEARRFQVSVTHPDGRAENWQRIGGNICDHALEAAELGGVGSVVRVIPLDQAAA